MVTGVLQAPIDTRYRTMAALEAVISHATIGATLQVRLEVGVVTHLLVHLLAIALTVGDDDLIGLRIENHRGREAEAPELLQILHSSVRLHHIGVGVDALLAP